MKTMGTTVCREIQREIDDADQAEPLSPVVNAHLRDCAGCDAYYNEQFKLRQIVFSLGTVEAPGDFDFRLRARLAAEKRGGANTFTVANLSFGFRSAAFASLVLLIGSALVFVSLRPTTNNTLVAENPANQQKSVANQTQNKTPGLVAKATDVKPAPPSVDTAEPQSDQSNAGGAGRNPGKRFNTKNSGLRSTQVALHGNPRVATKDLGSTPAKVFKPEDMVAGAGHSVFPIEASSQSLKVSLDNGRGSSKTISLPGVSFGSQRVLNESAPPLLASARGAW